MSEKDSQIQIYQLSSSLNINSTLLFVKMSDVKYIGTYGCLTCQVDWKIRLRPCTISLTIISLEFRFDRNFV